MRRECLFPLFLVLRLCLAHTALIAQNQEPLVSGTGLTDWRRVPMSPSPNSDLEKSSSDREARDNYWTKIAPPLSSKGGNTRISGVMWGPRAPEIRPIAGSFWAIGTFVGYDVHEASSGSIYTEIHLRLDRVIVPGTDTTPQEGKVVDIGIPGGVIRTPAGAIHQYFRKLASQYELQPGKRYLIQLLLVPNESFYEAEDYWEISNGVAVAVLPSDIAMVKSGLSHLAGLTETDATNYIQQAHAK